MEKLPSQLECTGCDSQVEPKGLPPFSCPSAKSGDGVDHVLRRRLDTGRLPFPKLDEPNPFVAFRTLSHSYHLGRSWGLSDQEFVELIRALDGRISQLDGHGFVRTPQFEAKGLARSAGWTGGLWVKDETNNVSGSHKARHMMGLALYLEAARAKGLDDGSRPLAISSCGNAALAAAVVARAAGRELEVFVPTWANPVVLERLNALGAKVATCERDPSVPGDPCTARFRERVAQGAIPFSCQGPDNGLVIEGGCTLGYEVLASGLEVDRVFIQVGGGALASACVQAFEEAVRWRHYARLPAIHAVQTEGAAPLARAYFRVLRRLLEDLGFSGPLPEADGRFSLSQLCRWAEFVLVRGDEPAIRRELRFAASHRANFMWPWEKEPQSAAHGILDDETYDWLVIVEGMLLSGGFPIVVAEPLVLEAHRQARKETDVRVDPTGSAGLAGLLAYTKAGLASCRERSLVLFTGKDRHA